MKKIVIILVLMLILGVVLTSGCTNTQNNTSNNGSMQNKSSGTPGYFTAQLFNTKSVNIPYKFDISKFNNL